MKKDRENNNEVEDQKVSRKQEVDGKGKGKQK